MSRANTSSIDSGDGYKLAHLSSQQKSDFQIDNSEKPDQVINARKASNLASAKKKAKLAKASKKKNKK